LEDVATKQIITDLADLVGVTVDERYELIRVLGRGGMGVVFEGVQRSMGRAVAVKMLQLGGVLEGESLQRFEREIGIIASLRHSNIVSVLDSGRDAQLGLFFIVMELVEGEPLSSLIGEPPATAHPAMALEITYQICAALTEPHAQGIIHRDIKPDNVLLMAMSDETVQVKVVDFGVARAWSSEQDEKLTGTGIALGTPSYMAPELCAADEIDARTDLYAVGILLYELLAGRPPFEGGGALALMLKHLNEAIPPLPQTHPALARWPEVEDLARRLMAKNPADRPQSAREVLRRIDAIRAQHGIGQVRVDPELPTGDALRAFFVPLPEMSQPVTAVSPSARSSAPASPATPDATARVTPGEQAALARAALGPPQPFDAYSPTARVITEEVAPTTDAGGRGRAAPASARLLVDRRGGAVREHGGLRGARGWRAAADGRRDAGGAGAVSVRAHVERGVAQEHTQGHAARHVGGRAGRGWRQGARGERLGGPGGG
jgi:eukaryotic-like serine/threonine-protein kinase